jgi:hypothetical protein
MFSDIKLFQVKAQTLLKSIKKGFPLAVVENLF